MTETTCTTHATEAPSAAIPATEAELLALARTCAGHQELASKLGVKLGLLPSWAPCNLLETDPTRMLHHEGLEGMAICAWWLARQGGPVDGHVARAMARRLVFAGEVSE